MINEPGERTVVRAVWQEWVNRAWLLEFGWLGLAWIGSVAAAQMAHDVGPLVGPVTMRCVPPPEPGVSDAVHIVCDAPAAERLRPITDATIERMFGV